MICLSAFCVAAVLFIFMRGGLPLAAESTSDGLVYEVSGGAVTITDYTGSASALTIPSSIGGVPVTAIGAFAFDGSSSLVRVTVPSSVVRIGEGAFRNCTSLAAVSIPVQTTSLGAYVFDGCPSVDVACRKNSAAHYYALYYGLAFTLSDASSTAASFEYDYEGDYIVIEKYIGTGGAVTIPSTIDGAQVRYIADFAFSNVHNVTSVTIPSTVRRIGKGAFTQCYDLRAINVDSDNYFYTSSDGVLYSLDKSELIQYPMAKSGTLFAIPTQVSKICYGAFRGSSLTSVTIPSNVQEIDHYAFADCASLSRFTISDSTLHIGRDILADTPWYAAQSNGIVYVGKVAYTIKGSVSSPELRSDTLALAAYLFEGSSFSSFNIPSSVRVIEYGAFLNCTSLKEISLPSSLQYLESHAFGGCIMLDTVRFNESTSVIMAGAFEGCYHPMFICSPGSTAEEYAEKYGNPLQGELRVPVVRITSVGETSIGIEWDAISGATGYNVYLNGRKITPTPLSTNYDVIVKLTNGRSYSIQVSAVNADSESALSVAVTAVTGSGSAGSGDVNSDGSVNIADVMYLFQYLSGGRSLSASQLAASDYNGDSEVNIADLLLIFRRLTTG